jgi:hypothetical protein
VLFETNEGGCVYWVDVLVVGDKSGGCHVGCFARTPLATPLERGDPPSCV